MTNIELIIKIPKEVYEHILKAKSVPDMLGIDIVNTINAVKNGTPLPKGHGALKDTDKIISDGISEGFCNWYDRMKYADTIIEADKAESEK